MSKIELRLSDVDPPEPDPPRTIYRDLRNLPSTTYLGLTIRFFNADDVTLYFQITGTGPGYTFSTANLGALASGANAYQNLDNFATRSKPGAALTETVDLILRAYTDAAYSNLKWTYTRTVTVIWIDSGDGSWTIDVLNNFDDGTVQTWAVACETGNCVTLTLAVATDYFLSAPNSLRVTHVGTNGQDNRHRLYKSITTPDRPQIYAIIDYRLRHVDALDGWPKYIEIVNGTTGAVLLHLGKVYDALGQIYVPENKWIRMVVPLPRNTTLELRIRTDFYQSSYQTVYVNMDDFKVISKS